MDLSLRPQQRPEQRMHTVTIEEIVSLGSRWDDARPPLENYFSPSRREQFEKDYIHYLNTLLLEMKHGNLDLDLYLVFVFTFQFIAPLLGIPAERELGQFYRILEQKYDVEDLDINLHFSTDEYIAPSGMIPSPREEDPEAADAFPGESAWDANEEGAGGPGRDQEKSGQWKDREHEPEPGAMEHSGKAAASGRGKEMISEEEALSAFQKELDATWEGRREVKESVQKRLKQDGIGAIMKWQKEKDFPELAEAFGRSVVIPSFFSFRDRKLLGFYRSTTEGITYEVAVPEILKVP